MTNALPKELLDWGSLGPLRLIARRLADGIYAGGHRSRRRGSGVEFDGHRDYVPGDDLRRLDTRALARHGRLLIRQFETDTERRLCLVLDASRSMAYKSEHAPAAKLAYAALLGAAMARIAIAAGDTVSLDWVAGKRAGALPASGGREGFERLVSALENVEVGGDDSLDASSFEASLGPVARRARRGSIVVFFSDFVDLPETAAARFAALSNRDRVAAAVRVLDPVEARFPFDGALRLRGSWGNAVVETDAAAARSGYLAALENQRKNWEEHLLAQGGRVIECTTDESPEDVLRRILHSIEGHRA
jgi:uncharacterized protein (DUF58 family)